MERLEEHVPARTVLMISVAEAAARIGISTSYYYQLIGAGKVPYKRVGFGKGKLLVPIKALEEWSAQLDTEAK